MKGGSLFTGIIEELGTVESIAEKKSGRRIAVSCSKLIRELKKGDSIAVSGVCLTAVEIRASSFAADLAQETWQRTSFSQIKPGSLVNLELPARANGRLGGHIVQGHVDGIGKVLAFRRISNDYVLTIEVPRQLTRYVVSKGSICLEGISLTVAKSDGKTVSVAIIPHTAKATNLKSLRIGDPVNVEVDVIAKYVEKMIAGNSSITMERLVKEGF